MPVAARPVASVLWYLPDGCHPLLVGFAVTMGTAFGGLLDPITAGFLTDVGDGQTMPILFALAASVLTVVLAVPAHRAGAACRGHRVSG